jgi:hypothetical protein
LLPGHGAADREDSKPAPVSPKRPSYAPRLGLWENAYRGEHPRAVYGDATTARVAGGYLNREGILTVEDWGCGLGGFKHCIGAWQRYVGIDGSQSPYSDLVVDLEHYASGADAVHLRHVLEHNPGWRGILANALQSFGRRMVLTIFTPFTEPTQVIARYPNFNGTGVEMVDIGFSRNDIVRPFGDLRWFSIENIRTDTQYGVEHMFFLEK